MSRLIQASVMAAIGVLVFASLLIPVVNDATTTEKTFDNTPYGYYQMKELETGDTWAFSDGNWTYNDQPITINNTDSTKVSIVASNNEVIRQDGLTRGTSYVGSDTTSIESVTVAGVDYLRINTTNVAYTSGYGATPAGDYVLKKYDTAGYVKEDTPLWVTGFTNLTESANSQLIVHIEGTIADGLTITVVPKAYSPVTDISIGEYTINYTVASEGIGLYKLNNVTFDVTGTFNEEEYTTTFTYSTFVIPKEVTAEKAIHADEPTRDILAVLPLIVIVGLIAGLVGYAVYSRIE